MPKNVDGNPILDFLPTAVIIFDRLGKSSYCNRSAEAIFDLDTAGGADSSSIMPAASWQHALWNGETVVYRHGVPITLSLHREDDQYIVCSTITEEMFTAQRTLLQLREHTNELRVLFDSYIDERIWITDGEGKTTFVSKFVASKHGSSPEELVGRYVQDLEREELFFPSVTVEVLRTNRQSAVLQKINDGSLCVSVGIPIFDSDGTIQRVISITRDFENHMEIGGELILSGSPIASPESDDIFSCRFITRNAEMRKMLAAAKQAAPTDSTILIEGETGVGKSLLAKLIHEASARSQGPFLSINCAVIAENLFESELFGYASGSFTGSDTHGKVGLIEVAQGGTLFLDEIEELSLSQQVKLLEVIQNRCITRVGSTSPIAVDVRILCASKSRLAELVTAGKFRKDLFYRLNVVTLHLPPLRARREDIQDLIHSITARINESYGLNKIFSPAAIEKLCQYDYPGNVRELVHAIEQTMVTTRSRKVDVLNLPEKIRINSGRASSHDVVVRDIVSLQTLVEQTERQLLRMALEKYAVKEEAASALEIGKATLWRKLKKYGMLGDLDLGASQKQ